MTVIGASDCYGYQGFTPSWLKGLHTVMANRALYCHGCQDFLLYCRGHKGFILLWMSGLYNVMAVRASY